METVIPAVRMATSFHFRLPDWTPQRLIAESLMAHNLRHLGELKLDSETTPWPRIKGAILAFLRHQQTSYNSKLLERCERDPELRDSLAREISASAHLRYPWLGKDDPRPFPVPEDARPAQLFTELARDLAHDHTVRDQLHSAIRDLKREGKLAQVEALKVTLAGVEQRIKRSYEILTSPKYGDQSSRTFDVSHAPEEMGRYYFFDDRQPTPNRYHFVGFRCKECSAPVVRLKQPMDFGQGWRMVIHSCFCRSLATVCPPAGRRLKPLTSQGWNFAADEEAAP